MDCKELIEQLRNVFQADGYELEQSVCESAAETISALSEALDAALEDLRGMCWCCVNGKPWEQAGPLSKLTGCEHLSELGVLARGGGKCKCPHWEWRGPQKAVSDSDTK